MYNYHIANNDKKKEASTNFYVLHVTSYSYCSNVSLMDHYFDVTQIFGCCTCYSPIANEMLIVVKSK